MEYEIKKPVGRPKVENRKTSKEFNTYHNNKLRNEEYFINYYNSKKAILITCEICSKCVNQYSLKQHYKSKKCQLCII